VVFEKVGVKIENTVETKTPTSWMPLRQAKTYQKIISKWTIPLRHTFMYYKSLFLLVLC